MPRVDGYLLDAGQAAVLARALQRQIRDAERGDGGVPRGVRELADSLAAFSRETTVVEVSAVRESGKAAVVTVGAESLTTGQAAGLLGLTRQRVGALCQSGDLDAMKAAGGHWQIDGASAAALAARRRGTG